jgi:hypothetical protein
VTGEEVHRTPAPRCCREGLRRKQQRKGSRVLKIKWRHTEHDDIGVMEGEVGSVTDAAERGGGEWTERCPGRGLLVLGLCDHTGSAIRAVGAQEPSCVNSAPQTTPLLSSLTLLTLGDAEGPLWF